MAWTPGIANIKLKQINSVTLEGLTTVVLSGDDLENGLSLIIADGEIFKAASGKEEEISEKATVEGNYISETKAESDALMALDGTSCLITLAFDSNEELILTSIPVSLNKQVESGKLTKITIKAEVTKANIDELLSYSDV